MTLTTFLLGSRWPGLGRAVTWLHYIMVANMAVLTWMLWPAGTVYLLMPLWLLVAMSFFWRHRPWFSRDSVTGRILD